MAISSVPSGVRGKINCSHYAQRALTLAWGLMQQMFFQSGRKFFLHNFSSHFYPLAPKSALLESTQPPKSFEFSPIPVVTSKTRPEGFSHLKRQTRGMDRTLALHEHSAEICLLTEWRQVSAKRWRSPHARFVTPIHLFRLRRKFSTTASLS